MGDIGRGAQAAASLGVAAIDSATRYGTTAMNNAAQKQIAQEYNQSQMDLAKYQNDYNQQMWNMQNEYNSPASQMKRLEEAGLNPNLIYGSSSSVGNSTSAPAPAATPDLKMPEYQPLSFGNVFSQALQSYYQMRAQDQQIELAKTQQDFVQSQIDGQRIKNIMEGAKTPFAKQIAERNVDMLESEYQEQRYNEVSAHYDAQSKQYRFQHIIPLEERKALTDIALRDSQIKLNGKQFEYVSQRTAEMMYRIENLLPQEVQMNEKKQELLTKQIAIATAEGTLKHMDVEFWKNLGVSGGTIKQIMAILKALLR